MGKALQTVEDLVGLKDSNRGEYEKIMLSLVLSI